MIYANNAGTSWPKAPGVPEAIVEALEAGPRSADALFEVARTTVCEFLGIREPERLLFTSSCTAALSVAIDDLPWRPGDRLLTSALEHHALARPVEKLAANRGVQHVSAPYLPGRPVDLDFVRDELRRGGVRLVALTAASNVTGELLPVREVARLAHEHGALCLVDAAQTVGVIPVEVKTLEADLLVFAGHKGPLGPQGIGGLWAASHVAFESPKAVCTIGECAPFPGYCDVGSVNVGGVAGLNVGLRWHLERGTDRLGRRQRAMAAALLAALQERPACTVYGGSGCERSATVSITHDRLPIEQAETFFAEREIVVRAGQHCAPWALQAIGAPQGTIRISFGPFNREDDVPRIIEAIDEAQCANRTLDL